jgi:CRP-like cAMP-binding protein
MDISKIVGESYLARGFTAEFVEKISGIALLKKFSSGEMILEEDDLNCDLMILAEGMASVKNGMGDLISYIKPTTPFGEVAFLDRMRRSSNVYAETDCIVVVLPEEPLRELFRQDPEMSVRALVNLSLILCERLRKATRQIAVLNAIEESNL